MVHLSSEQLESVARSYLAALERGAPFEELAAFFTPDCVQEEFPNRLVPSGARRTWADLKAAALRGHRAVEAQRYEVLGLTANGNRVAIEVGWSARVLVPFGSLSPGDTMSARLVIFLTFHDGKIQRQHNYDCFAPF